MREAVLPYLAPLVLPVLFAVAGGAQAQPPYAEPPVTPEIPVLLRDTADMREQARPYIGSLKTSIDGRIGMAMKEGGSQLGGTVTASKIYVIRPEQITSAHFLESSPVEPLSAPAEILWDTAPGSVAEILYPGVGLQVSLGHAFICDATPQVPGPGERVNPYTCPDDPTRDCYDLTIVTGLGSGPHPSLFPSGTDFGLELWGVPVVVRVVDPKTAQAEIESITVLAPEVKRAQFVRTQHPLLKAMFEPMVTADGRLFIMRRGQTGFVYSYIAPSDGEPCDVVQWAAHSDHPDPLNFDFIEDMPDDPRLFDGTKPLYGMAAYPYVDPEGVPVPYLKGTYPWMDREGTNLFFTGVKSNLYYPDSSGSLVTRHEVRCANGGTAACDPDSTSNENPTQQKGFLMNGAWTRGKTVLLDGLVNNQDYGLGAALLSRRELRLFQPNTAPPGVDASGWVEAGDGYDSTGYGHNATTLDSSENLLNGLPAFRPQAPSEVVWLLHAGKVSVELPFDDYLDLDTVIFSDGTASLSSPGSTWMVYRDGFEYVAWNPTSAPGPEGLGFVGEVRLQNAATTDRFETSDGARHLPPYGRTVGASRIEPLALGGVTGKGFWLTGVNRVEYDFDADLRVALAGEDFYLSLFVDPRHDASAPRRLVTLPNGAAVDVTSATSIALHPGNGEATRVVGGAAMTSFLRPSEWTHLGIAVRNGGADVDLYLNGYLYATEGFGPAAFTLDGPALVVGSGSGGFRGWIDELRVTREIPTVEEICNHAHGTLVGLQPSDDGPLRTRSQLYPAEGHLRIESLLGAGAQAALDASTCNHPVGFAEEQGVRDPVEGVPLRQEIVFPEGPLYRNVPRPDSTANAFCLGCHSSSGFGGLGLAALAPVAGVDAVDDPRRMPTQPPPRTGGNIPANLFGPGNPVTDEDAPPEGARTDDYVLPLVPECDNGVDDDGDGLIDFDGVPGGPGPDPHCLSASDNKELAGGGSCGLLGVEIAAVLALRSLARTRRTRSTRRGGSDPD